MHTRAHTRLIHQLLLITSREIKIKKRQRKFRQVDLATRAKDIYKTSLIRRIVGSFTSILESSAIKLNTKITDAQIY